MRNMNCRNVRHEIEEAAPGKWLSSDVSNHVLSCVGCETLLREQTKLRELVSALGTVAAPSDFDFRLRARLAEEKRKGARPFTLGNFSFGLRPVAMVSILLLLGFALALVSVKTGLNKAGSERLAMSALASGAGGTVEPKIVNHAEDKTTGQQAAVAKADSQSAPKRQNNPGQRGLVAERDTKQQNTRDSASTKAPVLNRDQLAGVYPSAAFPINGGYQSLRVSVDDGRGTSRTISLPSVSFGSQRSLSQGSSPLMASARGAW